MKRGREGGVLVTDVGRLCCVVSALFSPPFTARPTGGGGSHAEEEEGEGVTCRPAVCEL